MLFFFVMKIVHFVLLFAHLLLFERGQLECLVQSNWVVGVVIGLSVKNCNNWLANNLTTVCSAENDHINVCPSSVLSFQVGSWLDKKRRLNGWLKQKSHNQIVSLLKRRQRQRLRTIVQVSCKWWVVNTISSLSIIVTSSWSNQHVRTMASNYIEEQLFHTTFGHHKKSIN